MTGRGRGRPPKGGRVDVMKASEGSPEVRRSTRQQHQQNDAFPEDDEFANADPIDPNLHYEKDSSMAPPPVGIKPSQRGTRRDPERHASFGPSLKSVWSQQPSDVQSSPFPDHASTQQVTPTPAPGTSVRGTSITSSQANGTLAWKKKKVPQELVRLWEMTKGLYAHLHTHPLFRPDGTDFLSEEEAVEWGSEKDHCSQLLDACRFFFLRRAGDPVIHPNYVVEDLMDTDPSSREGFRASRKIYATNFVALLEEALKIDGQERESRLTYLQSWDDWFPQVFFEGSEDCKEQSQRILEVVMGIRTQRLILTLKDLEESLEGQSHEQKLSERVRAVANIFCHESTELLELVQEFQHRNMEIRRIPFIDIETLDNGTESKDQYTHRVRDIVNSLQDSPDSSVLEEDFPFDIFLQDIRDFVVQNFERLQVALDGAEESQQIQSQLEAEALAIERMHGNPNGEAYMQDFPQVDRLQSQDILARSKEVQATQYFGSAAYPPTFGHSAPQSSGSMYAESAAQVAGIKRPGPDAPAPTSAPAPRKRKRRRNLAEEASAALVPVPEEGYSVPFRPQVEPDFEAVSQRAREISAANRKPPQPQVRSAWVREDTMLLTKAVHTYSCKWSQIERAIKEGTLQFQRPRDQQALRDKARLLKQDMLKSDAFLPPSFDLVVLGKKERLAVIACGKNPDRRESDVDANGKPINTEWVEDTDY